MQDYDSVLVAVPVTEVLEAQEKAAVRGDEILVTAEPGWFDEKEFLPFGFYDWYRKAILEKRVLKNVPITTIKLAKISGIITVISMRATYKPIGDEVSGRPLDSGIQVNGHLLDTRVTITRNECRTKNNANTKSYRKVIQADKSSVWMLMSEIKRVSYRPPVDCVIASIPVILDKVQHSVGLLVRSINEEIGKEMHATRIGDKELQASLSIDPGKDSADVIEVFKDADRVNRDLNRLQTRYTFRDEDEEVMIENFDMCRDALAAAEKLKRHTKLLFCSDNPSESRWTDEWPHIKEAHATISKMVGILAVSVLGTSSSARNFAEIWRDA